MKTRLSAVLVLAVAVAGVCSAWAFAAGQPDKTTGVISACYKTSGGDLRVATTACTASETKLSWQSGAAQLRADIAAGAANATVLNKDGLKMQLACYLSPVGVWTAEMHLKPSAAANVNGSYVEAAESGPSTTTPVGTTVAAHADAAVITVGRSGGGFARAEGELTIDTPTHVVTTVFHLIANSVTDRCQLTGTATLT